MHFLNIRGNLTIANCCRGFLSALFSGYDDHRLFVLGGKSVRIFSIIGGIILLTIAPCYAGPAGGGPDLSPYDRHIMYQVLILFWIGIIGLITIIIVKLREIKRTQEMGLHKDESDAPSLD